MSPERGASDPEILARLEPMAVVAQHLHVAVCVLATEGLRTYVVHVHLVTVAASAVGRGLGAVDAAHGHPLVVLVRVVSLGTCEGCRVPHGARCFLWSGIRSRGGKEETARSAPALPAVRRRMFDLRHGPSVGGEQQPDVG